MAWVALLVVSPAWAQVDIDPIEAASASGIASNDAPEYGGLVLSQVLTSLGDYFHTKFAEGWSAQKDAADYVLTVRERSSPKVGTEIQVLAGDDLVFRSLLPRSYAQVAALTEAAVEQVHNRVVESGLQNLLFNDPDVARSAF
jgi:curli production assembly/transport component CsgE